MSFEAELLSGKKVKGDQLKLPRAKTILRAALAHRYVSDISCAVKIDGSEIIEFTLNRLEIPEEPSFPINTCEPIAIVCDKKDLDIPDVYATRKDFPIGLPHSNAREYSNPVSICVSDVDFSDIRLQFNAYDFIQSIRRWFELNSLNQLHEEDRPLEVFFISDEYCTFLNRPSASEHYLQYKNICQGNSTIVYVGKDQATHFEIRINTDELVSSNFAQKPRTISDLESIQTSNKMSFNEELLLELKAATTNDLEVMVLLLLNEKRRAKANAEGTEFFLICLPFTVRNFKDKMISLNSEQFIDWFNNSNIRIISLLPPLCREINCLCNGLQTLYEKASIIGVGTLGSLVTDHFVRMGICKEIVAIDLDHFYPHNFARHILPSSALMQPKVYCLKELYQGVFNQQFQAIQTDVMTLTKDQQSMAFSGCDLIVDMSTSIAIERMLSFDPHCDTIRKCTAFLNPMGTDIVLFMEDKAHKDRLDLLEMAYYRELIVNDALSNHLNVAGHHTTNKFSCRSESAIINYDNVGVLASIASSQIRKRAVEKQSSIGIWRINEDSGEVNVINISPLGWTKYSTKDCRILICNSFEQFISNERTSSGRNETGGCVFGCYDRDRKIIYILYASKAPVDSNGTSNSFIRGTNGLKELCDAIKERTYYQVRYLGEWHSHPIGSNNPSSYDDIQYKEMSKKHLEEDIPFVQVIIGSNGLFVRCRM